MTTTHNNRVFPGLLDSNIEFFNKGNDLKVFSNGSVMDFKDVPPIIYNYLNERLHDDLPALAILESWYPNSTVDQIFKFTKCRFGGLDYTPDIAQNKLQPGEYWECPKRGNCIGEGIVCKNANYNNQELTHDDVTLMKMLTTNKTNEVIAQDINVSFGQLHKHKKILYNKIDAQTRQCVSSVLAHLNLI